MFSLEEALKILQRYFSREKTNTVGSTTNNNVCLSGDNNKDLCPIEVFFSSTKSSIELANMDKKVGINVSGGDFRFAGNINEVHTIVSLEEKNKELKKQKQLLELQKIKQHNQQSLFLERLIGQRHETQPLCRYLLNSMREEITNEKLETARQEEKEAAKRRVPYISPSFFFDALYPTCEGIHKRASILRLIEEGHIEEDNNTCSQSPFNSTTFCIKNIESTIFKQKPLQDLYEENLQALLLHSSSRYKESQKSSAKNSIVAYLALFAPTHDSIVEIVEGDEKSFSDHMETEGPSRKIRKRDNTAEDISFTTTLRGMFSNILDGTLYKDLSLASLKYPFRLAEPYTAGDIKCFCNNALLMSFFAIFLTYLDLKVWRYDRLPAEYFLQQDCEDLITFKLNKKEVLYDKKTGYWIYIKKKKLYYSKHFWTTINSFM